MDEGIPFPFVKLYRFVQFYVGLYGLKRPIGRLFWFEKPMAQKTDNIYLEESVLMASIF